MTKKTIEETLNLTPMVIEDTPYRRMTQEETAEVEGSAIVLVDGVEEEIDNDFQFARENLYKILETGNKALEDIAKIADQSQHPRAFEAIATLVTVLTGANKDLMELREKKQRLSKKETTNEKNVTNNNLFVGSTKELQEMLKKVKAGQLLEDDENK